MTDPLSSRLLPRLAFWMAVLLALSGAAIALSDGAKAAHALIKWNEARLALEAKPKKPVSGFGVFLAAQTQSGGQKILRARLEEAATLAGLEVKTLAPIPPAKNTPAKDASEVLARISARGPIEDVYTFLHAVEARRPALIVDRAELTHQNGELEIALNVRGRLAPPGWSEPKPKADKSEAADAAPAPNKARLQPSDLRPPAPAGGPNWQTFPGAKPPQQRASQPGLRGRPQIGTRNPDEGDEAEEDDDINRPPPPSPVE